MWGRGSCGDDDDFSCRQFLFSSETSIHVYGQEIGGKDYST